MKKENVIAAKIVAGNKTTKPTNVEINHKTMIDMGFNAGSNTYGEYKFVKIFMGDNQLNIDLDVDPKDFAGNFCRYMYKSGLLYGKKELQAELKFLLDV